jgi:hypothetical protein
MSDHDLLTAVKEDFAAVRMDVPAEVILARGSSRKRRRRRARGLAIAAMTAAGLGLAVSALTSWASLPRPPAERASAQRPSDAEHTGDATLAAWTVVMQPDGALAVTIHDLRNIAGLQQRLDTADAHTVVYARRLRLPGCLNFRDADRLSAIVTTKVPLGPDDVYFVIHPAVIPRGSTLQVDVLPPGWPSPDPAPHQRFPAGTRAGLAGLGFGSGPEAALHAPTINLSLIYTNSNCS